MVLPYCDDVLQLDISMDNVLSMHMGDSLENFLKYSSSFHFLDYEDRYL